MGGTGCSQRAQSGLMREADEESHKEWDSRTLGAGVMCDWEALVTKWVVRVR